MVPALVPVQPMLVVTARHRSHDRERRRVDHGRRRDHDRTWRANRRSRRVNYRRPLHDDRRSRMADDNVRQWRQWDADMHVNARLRRCDGSKQNRRENQQFFHTGEQTPKWPAGFKQTFDLIKHLFERSCARTVLRVLHCAAECVSYFAESRQSQRIVSGKSVPP